MNITYLIETFIKVENTSPQFKLIWANKCPKLTDFFKVSQGDNTHEKHGSIDHKIETIAHI
ncbi:MAG: hypothetical protein WCJ99_13665 [Betaproteobacteria bacterium]|jgi:hypothetical protein